MHGLCDEWNRIYPARDGGRDVFALDSIIVKSSHLHGEDESDFKKDSESQPVEKDYSYADANEVQAIRLARSVLTDVKTPDIYFAGKVRKCYS